jgi:hypothetical protein
VPLRTEDEKQETYCEIYRKLVFTGFVIRGNVMQDWAVSDSTLPLRLPSPDTISEPSDPRGSKNATRAQGRFRQRLEGFAMASGWPLSPSISLDITLSSNLE